MKSIFGLSAPVTKQELNKTTNELVLIRRVNIDFIVDKIIRKPVQQTTDKTSLPLIPDNVSCPVARDKKI